MKIYTQSHTRLIDVNDIRITEEAILAIIDEQNIIVLGKYQDIHFTEKRLIIHSKGLCQLVLNDMVRYFNDNPNKIFCIPSQEEMKDKIKDKMGVR